MMFDSVYVFTKGLEAALLEGPELQIRQGEGEVEEEEQIEETGTYDKGQKTYDKVQKNI